jgi:hypothetical protein
MNAPPTLARLRAQVIEGARARTAPTRAQRRLRNGIVTSVIVLIPISLFIAWGGVRASPRPTQLVLETALGSALLACLTAFMAFGRGRSMVGRPRPWLLAVVLVTPVLLLAWRILPSLQYPGMMEAFRGRPGLRCLGLGIAFALAPLLGVLWMRRGLVPVQPRLTAAAFGVAASAGAWVLVDLWCPVGYVPHLLLGHVLPLMLVALLGALLGKRILAPSVDLAPQTRRFK